MYTNCRLSLLVVLFFGFNSANLLGMDQDSGDTKVQFKENIKQSIDAFNSTYLILSMIAGNLIGGGVMSCTAHQAMPTRLAQVALCGTLAASSMNYRNCVAILDLIEAITQKHDSLKIGRINAVREQIHWNYMTALSTPIVLGGSVGISDYLLRNDVPLAYDTGVLVGAVASTALYGKNLFDNKKLINKLCEGLIAEPI